MANLIQLHAETNEFSFPPINQSKTFIQFEEPKILPDRPIRSNKTSNHIVDFTQTPNDINDLNE